MTIKITRVKMKDESERIKLETPYHPEIPKRARELGGTWNATKQAWYFDLRDEERVRAMTREVYGTDGEETLVLTTIRVELDKLPQYWDDGSLFLAGRQVLRRANRDWKVSLGEGVVVIQGGFPSSGGSRNNPRLHPESGTVLEIRDVPQTLAEAEADKYPAVITIVQTLPQDMNAQAKLAELIARRDQLQKEMDLINEQLHLLAGMVPAKGGD